MADTDQLINAFLIHRRGYREDDLLLDFFSKEHGMLRCVSRYGRKSRRSITAFTLLNISLRGKGELKTLASWESMHISPFLTGDDLVLALYINELLYRLLQPHDEAVELFNAYNFFILQLPAATELQKRWLLRLFEKKLLEVLGYGVDYALDAQGANVDKNKRYIFQEQTGLTADVNGHFSGEMLLYLKRAEFDYHPDEVALKQCRNLFRIRLNSLLDNKPLNTKALFHKMK